MPTRTALPARSAETVGTRPGGDCIPQGSRQDPLRDRSACLLGVADAAELDPPAADVGPDHLLLGEELLELFPAHLIAGDQVVVDLVTQPVEAVLGFLHENPPRSPVMEQLERAE